MRYTFEEEFRVDHPETVGETDRHFDIDNYKDWLEGQLLEARKQLALYDVVGRSEQCDHDYSDGTGTGWNVCKKCGDMY